MSDHLHKQDLENLLLTPERVQEGERSRMDAHLLQCALCREHMDALSQFYGDLTESLSEPPLDRDKEFARRLLDPSRKEELPGQLLRLPPHKESSLDLFFQSGDSRRPTAITRTIRYIRNNPVRFAGGMSLAAALCVFAVLAIRPSVKDPNPVYAKIRDYVLTVYNKDGLPLWTKGVPGMPDATSERKSIQHVREPIGLSVDDIDGDGLAEVLMTAVQGSPGYATDTLYCYDMDGFLRWKSGVGALATFGDPKQAQHTRSVIRSFVSFRKSPMDSVQLFVLAHDQYLSPSKLYEVSAKDGRELHAYHHRGMCDVLLHHDVDGDGNEELVLAGVNDGFNRAALAVLDPSNIVGCAPVPRHEIPLGLLKASEKYYILFPLLRLAQDYRRVLYNSPVVLSATDRGQIVATIDELLRADMSLPEKEIHVIYTFERNMRVGAVSGTDAFLNFHDWLLKAGKIRKSAIPACYDELRDSVKYWDGEKFVVRGELTPDSSKNNSLP